MKARKPQAARTAAELESKKAAAATSGADPTLNVAEQIAELDGKITTLKNKHEEEWNAIQELKSSRDGQMSGFKEIIDKKKDVRAETLLSSG